MADAPASCVAGAHYPCPRCAHHMIENLQPLLNTLPPKTANALRQAINVCGDRLGMDSDWVQRWVAFTVVADALAAYAVDGERVFEFKGGAAIEMRFRELGTPAQGVGRAAPTPGVQPRATKDLDATYHGTLDALAGAVEAALKEPRHGFAFRVRVDTPDAPHMRRFRIHVSYLETRFNRMERRDFSNVKLEVSVYEGQRLPPDSVRAFSLKPFGLEGPEFLPCIPLIKQIAQKLHAVTEPPDKDKTNDRFRDLLDIVMLSALTPPSPELRAVCEETFKIRRRHGWPPAIVTYPHWIEPMEQRAREMGLDQRSADEIVAYVADYVRQIASIK